MFENINFSGMKVLDAMCGNGETTKYLLQKGCQVTGVDISEGGIRHLQERWPECDAHCASILSTGFSNNSYDCVAVVGGLHHLHPNVFGAIKEIHRVLKPDGYFCFVEPHKGSVADRIRRFWYRVDNSFAKNEAAIDIEALKQEFSLEFEFSKEDYKGNIAYLLVLNSLIFRIPLRIKPIYSPILLKIESVVERIQGKLLSCFVVCQWKKK